MRPYFKVASPYAKAILWICPAPDEAKSTHTQRFFANFTGKMLRDEWAAFDAKLSKYLPNWREQCVIRDSDEKADWDQKIVSSNYKYVTFSVSTNLRVLLPYPDCRILDSSIDDSPLAEHYRQILAGVKHVVEGRLKDISS